MTMLRKGFVHAFYEERWEDVRERLGDPHECPFLWDSSHIPFAQQMCMEELNLPEVPLSFFSESVESGARREIDSEPSYSIISITVMEKGTNVMGYFILGGVVPPIRTKSFPDELNRVTAALYALGLQESNPFWLLSKYDDLAGSVVRDVIDITSVALAWEGEEKSLRKTFDRSTVEYLTRIQVLAGKYDPVKEPLRYTVEYLRMLRSDLPYMLLREDLMNRSLHICRKPVVRKGIDGDWKILKYKMI